MPPLIYLQRDLCFVEIIEGETDDLERQVCESSLVECLGRSGVVLQSIEINGAGCFVVIACADVERLKTIVRPFNVAIRVHEHCSRIAVRQGPRHRVLPALGTVITALHERGVRIIHVDADRTELAVLVDAALVDPTMAVLTAIVFESTNRMTRMDAPARAGGAVR
jgi:hypothetical protein